MITPSSPLTDLVQSDSRVENVCLTVRDGIMLAWKRRNRMSSLEYVQLVVDRVSEAFHGDESHVAAQANGSFNALTIQRFNAPPGG